MLRHLQRKGGGAKTKNYYSLASIYTTPSAVKKKGYFSLQCQKRGLEKRSEINTSLVNTKSYQSSQCTVERVRIAWPSALFLQQ